MFKPPKLCLFFAAVFYLITSVERFRLRVYTHLRYQFLLFLENIVIYHSNCNYSPTQVSLIRLVALVP